MSINTSNIERDYMKINFQQGAHLKNSNHGIEFFLEAKNIYQPIGNSYLEFFDESIRLVNNALAYAFS